jgi:hypothetical protein
MVPARQDEAKAGRRMQCFIEGAAATFFIFLRFMFDRAEILP